MSVVRRVKTTKFSSGDTWGSDMRSIASISWTEKGWVLSAGETGEAKNPVHNTIIIIRVMG
jgi:hypothetical protein